uniref:Uncharacterized protein n=1 Tax=Anguilla anguilla TaxID=7936 RepID=A0A0E9XHC4_ANGAN
MDNAKGQLSTSISLLNAGKMFKDERVDCSPFPIFCTVFCGLEVYECL